MNGRFLRYRDGSGGACGGTHTAGSAPRGNGGDLCHRNRLDGRVPLSTLSLPRTQRSSQNGCSERMISFILKPSFCRARALHPLSITQQHSRRPAAANFILRPRLLLVLLRKMRLTALGAVSPPRPGPINNFILDYVICS